MESKLGDKKATPVDFKVGDEVFFKNLCEKQKKLAKDSVGLYKIMGLKRGNVMAIARKTATEVEDKTLWLTVNADKLCLAKPELVRTGEIYYGSRKRQKSSRKNSENSEKVPIDSDQGEGAEISHNLRSRNSNPNHSTELAIPELAELRAVENPESTESRALEFYKATNCNDINVFHKNEACGLRKISSHPSLIRALLECMKISSSAPNKGEVWLKDSEKISLRDMSETPTDQDLRINRTSQPGKTNESTGRHKRVNRTRQTLRINRTRKPRPTGNKIHQS